jgi:hypothetical protein
MASTVVEQGQQSREGHPQDARSSDSLRVVMGLHLPTAADADAIIGSCQKIYVAVLNGGRPSDQGSSRGGAPSTSRAVMIPVDASTGEPVSQQLDELRMTLLQVLHDLTVSGSFYSPPQTYSATNPFSAVDQPGVFFHEQKYRGLQDVRASCAGTSIALRRLGLYFGLLTPAEAAAGAAGVAFSTDIVEVEKTAAAAIPHSFSTSSCDAAVLPASERDQARGCLRLFIEASEALLNWATTTLQVVESRQQQGTAARSAFSVAAGSESQPGVPGSREGGTTTADAVLQAQLIYDISDKFSEFKARADHFLLPNAYVYDVRAQCRVLAPVHFSSLRKLIQEIDAETVRLRTIQRNTAEQTAASVPSDTPTLHPAAMRVGGTAIPSASGTGGTSVIAPPTTIFKPRIGEFEYLRDSLQLILSIAMTEDELSTLTRFRALYEVLHEELEGLQAELAADGITFGIPPIGRSKASLAPEASSSAPQPPTAGGAPQATTAQAESSEKRQEQGASPDSSSEGTQPKRGESYRPWEGNFQGLAPAFVRRFMDFRRRMKQSRQSFLLDIKRKNVSHAPIPTASSGAAAQKASSVTREVFGFMCCRPELEDAKRSVRGGTGVNAGSPLVEQKLQLLEGFDFLWSQTEGLARMLELRFPDQFRASWGEHLRSLGDSVRTEWERLALAFSQP